MNIYREKEKRKGRKEEKKKFILSHDSTISCKVAKTNDGPVRLDLS